jgi:hypothetical protein
MKIPLRNGLFPESSDKPISLAWVRYFPVKGEPNVKTVICTECLTRDAAFGRSASSTAGAAESLVPHLLT